MRTAFAVALAVSPATAQQIFNAATGAPVRVVYTLSWLEVSTSNLPVPNPNGVLEPGESARIRLALSLSDPVGTPVTTPAGPGTLLGFHAMHVDLIGSPTTAGAWSHLSIAPAFNITALYGDPNPSGTIVADIAAGQIAAVPGSVNPQNPIPDIWTGVWTPNSYDFLPRSWTLAIGSGNPGETASLVYVGVPQVPGGLYGDYSLDTFGTLTIIPAPGSALLLAAAAFGRRRA